MEFDGHIVTVESIGSTEVSNQSVSAPRSEPIQKRVPPPPLQPQPQPQPQQNRHVPQARPIPQAKLPKKRMIQKDEEEEEEDAMDMDVSEPTVPLVSPQAQPVQSFQAQKRVRVGLSKRTMSTLHQTTHPATANPTIPASVALQPTTKTEIPVIIDAISTPR